MSDEPPIERLSAGATLLVIDVQRAFDDPAWGARNNPGAEARIADLLLGWRRSGRLVVHVRHRNDLPGRRFSEDGPGFAAKAQAVEVEGEVVIVKTVNSAFIGTDLEARLRAAGSSTLVIVGITTDHCVSTTARMAGNLGFQTFLVADATATFERVGPDGRRWSAEEMHQSALASLHQEFATVVSSTDVLAALGQA